MATLLSQIDLDALKKCQFIIKPYGKQIDFQFPPRITSESKSGKWESAAKKDAVTYENPMVYKGSDGKEITLEYDYVVHTLAGWNAKRIENTVKDLKGYYYKSVTMDPLQCPTVWLTIYDVVPNEMSYRMNNIGVKFSDEVIRDNGTWWPLHTKITLQMAMYTNVESPNGVSLLSITHLKKFNPTEDVQWY